MHSPQASPKSSKKSKICFISIIYYICNMNQVTDNNYQKESSFEVTGWNSEALKSWWRNVLTSSVSDPEFQGEFNVL